MNEGPFRMPSQAERNAHDDQPEQASKPAEVPKVEQFKPKAEEPKKMRRNLKSHSLGDEKSYKKPLFIGVGALVALAIVVLGGWTLFSGMGNTSGIDGGKYQAVFFTNGQVYFGKLQTFNSDYMKLTDIYYLQTQSADAESENPQKTTTDQGNPTLIKLGSEIHGPEDAMIISKDQVLFYENLKTDGKVAQSIEKFKNPN